MANVVVVGSQWGDEGKGKIVDWLSEQADIVVRFQGGHNAGHTLVIGGVTYKLSLLPSGVVRPGKLSVIGNGVVLDPQALLTEIANLRKQGITVTPDNLRIAENTALILPLHRELDGIRESGQCSAAHRYVVAVADKLRSSSPLRINHAVMHGVPEARICERAIDADLVVMTSHGRTGLSRAWLGSVADAVVRQSSVPVLDCDQNPSRSRAAPPLMRSSTFSCLSTAPRPPPKRSGLPSNSPRRSALGSHSFARSCRSRSSARTTRPSRSSSGR